MPTNTVLRLLAVFSLMTICGVAITSSAQSFHATYNLRLKLSETLTEEDRRAIASLSPYLYRLESKGTLSMTVDSESITVSGAIPVQIMPSRNLKEPPKIAPTSYLVYYSKKDRFLLIGEGRLEAINNWNTINRGSKIPINSVMIWNLSPETIFLGNPTRYLASQWQPEPGVLLLLAGVDPSILGLKQSPVNVSEYVLDTGSMRVTAKYETEHPSKTLAEIKISAGNVDATYRVLQLKKLQNFHLPSEIEFSLQSGNKHHQVRFKLERISANQSDTSASFGIPLGVTVNDFRHLQEPATPELLTEERAVKYIWRGRIPASTEILELASRQGRVIPPETGSRRYSLLLFVPAVLFFTLAAYFYFRGRRR